MRRGTALLCAVALFVSCLGGESGRPLGGTCTSDGECQGGLVCQYGRCRSECAFDRDCPAGTVCVASPADPALRVCTLEDEGGCQSDEDCGDLECDESTGLCREECDWDRPCEGPRVCQDGVCVEACAEEERCNGIDDDCDGVVDEEDDGALCASGESCVDGRCGPGGVMEWSHVLTGLGTCSVYSAAVDRDGNVVVAGEFGGELDDAPEASQGAVDGFVAILSAADGGLLDFHHLPGTDEVRVIDVAADASGDIAVCGYYSGSIDLPGGPRTANEEDAFLLRLGSDGELLAGEGWGGAGNDYCASVAFDATGNIIAVGTIYHDATIGEVVLPYDGHPYNSVVLSFRPDGGLGWHHRFEGEGLRMRGLSITATGDLLVSGWFTVSVMLGERLVENVHETVTGGEVRHSGPDAVLAALSAEGDFLWGETFGDTLVEFDPYSEAPNWAEGLAVAAHPSGAVVAGGLVTGSWELCGEPIEAGGEEDALLMVYEPQAGCRRATTFGSAGSDAIVAVAASRDGHVAVAGSYTGSIDLGDGPRSGVAGFDLFVASFDRDGTLRWAGAGGGEETDGAWTVEWHPSGAVIAAGTFQGTIEVGGGTITSGATRDGFVAFVWD